jgi:hypothetical protein
MSESQSQSELLYDWRFTANQFVLATSPLRLTTSNFIFQLNPYGYSPYVISSLTKGWVCSLQLLLVFTVILRSESRGTHDHSLLPQVRDSPNLEGQVPVFIPPGTGWPSYTPRHWVPFSSSPTTRRVTVEVFDPASSQSKTRNQSYFTTGGLRPINSSWRHDSRLTTRIFLNLCGNSPHVTSSLTRRWACFLIICLAFRQVYISHI